jgi:hypothetical protein
MNTVRHPNQQITYLDQRAVTEKIAADLLSDYGPALRRALKLARDTEDTQETREAAAALDRALYRF